MPASSSFRQVVLKAFGGTEQLEVVTQPELPTPAANEIRIKVAAAGTGFTDTIIRQGQYVDVKDKPPFVLGYDWFGQVDAIGENVTAFAVGDWAADLSVIGGYTEYLCVDEHRAVKAPGDLDPAEAVCMLLSYTTAYQMLTRITDIPTGSSCLVHAAGGAVGSALLDLCRHRGLKAYGTGSPAKRELIESRGGIFIDYHSNDVTAALRQYEPTGVDVIFDTLGGNSWSRSYNVLKRGGLLVAYGALQITTGEESIPSLLWGFAKLLLLWRLIPDGRRTTFYNIQKRRERHPSEFTADVKTLFSLLQAGKLHPAIAERRELADIREIHDRLDRGRVSGKIVLVMDPS